VSILAEVIAARSGRDARALRDAAGPIHGTDLRGAGRRRNDDRRNAPVPAAYRS
jgi:hypothetical protein